MSKLSSELGGRKNLNIAEDTYDRLKGRGKFQESFDDLLNRLLDEIEEFEKKTHERASSGGKK